MGSQSSVCPGASSGKKVYHNGYDIAVPVGTPVHPTQSGIVYYAGAYKGYGNLVVVEHGEGYVTMYGHNSEILVKPGDKVRFTIDTAARAITKIDKLKD